MQSRIGAVDGAAAAAQARVVLAPAVRRLSARDRRILFLRFFEGRDQREIGVTQMQVSRLLARILCDLRTSIDTPTPGDDGPGLTPPG